MANRLVPAGMGFFDTSGNPLSGGKLEFFESGTSNSLDTFSDDSLSSANANPVILNSGGRPASGATDIDVFGKDQDYKMVLSDSADVQIATFDPLRGFGSAADSVLDDTLRSTLVSGGSANAYTLTVNQTFAAYADGQEFTFEANHTNTGAATLNVTPAGGSALGAKSIIWPDATALAADDIVNGGKLAVKYDGTNFHLLTTHVVPLARSKQLQVVSTIVTGHTTGTTTIPKDNTIPQNTEGNEIMTLAITPKSATSTLLIEVIANLSNTATGVQAMALFQDSTADALAVVSENIPDANSLNNLAMRFTMTSGTTSATTFKARAGNHNAGTNNFNGSAGAGLYNGTMASSIVITEIAA